MSSSPIKVAALSIGLAAASLCLAQSQPDGVAKERRKAQEGRIIEALGLHEGSVVADIGAGSGGFEGAFAAAVGAKGRVYAEDIDQKHAIPELKKKISKEHWKNVQTILGTADDPKLPAPSKLDGVVMVIMYHEIAKPDQVLAKVNAALKPGGRLVIVDMHPHRTASRPRADQVKNHVIAADLVLQEVTAAGFELVLRDDKVVDYPDEESSRFMLVFRTKSN